MSFIMLMKRNDFRKSLKTIKSKIKANQDSNKTLESKSVDTSDEKPCTCVDTQGAYKNLYDSNEDAKKVARHLRKIKKLALDIYPCPDGFGWHLTKR